MNRLDFMKELERLLADISESERKEALQYYNDYLNDAGVENEEEVIASLGSPQKVAETIKAGLLGEDEGAFTENGYQDYENQKNNAVAVRETETEQSGRQEEPMRGQQNAQTNDHKPAAKKHMSSGMLILVILLCILFSPVIFSLGVGLLAIIFGILVTLAATIFSLFIGASAAAFGLLISGIVLLGVGIAKLFVSPLGGITLLAGGMLCSGIGLLFLALTVWLAGKAVPAVIRFIVDIFARLFHRKGEAAA